MASRSGFGPYRAFGEYIEKIRKRRPTFTQSKVARQAAKSGLLLVKQGKLSELERGWNSNPEPELFKQLAALYGVSYQDLVREWVKTRYHVNAADVFIDRHAPVSPPLNTDPHGTQCVGVITGSANPRVSLLVDAFLELSPKAQDHFVLHVRFIADELSRRR